MGGVGTTRDPDTDTDSGSGESTPNGDVGSATRSNGAFDNEEEVDVGSLSTCWSSPGLSHPWQEREAFQEDLSVVVRWVLADQDPPSLRLFGEF